MSSARSAEAAFQTCMLHIATSPRLVVISKPGIAPQDHPYRDICGVRKDASGSLVKLHFDMLPPLDEAAATQQGVPAGLPYSRLQAQMAELEVVFLSRFVFELLR